MSKVAAEAVVLEPFRLEVARDLVRMWRESFELGVGVVDPHPIEQQEEFLLRKLVPGYDVRVAFLDGLLVGFVAASPESIAQLHVRKGFHRRGIGTQLLDWAKRQSHGSLWLYTFQRNTVAQAFYERHGFQVVARGHEPSWKLDDLKYEWRADG